MRKKAVSQNFLFIHATKARLFNQDISLFIMNRKKRPTNKVSETGSSQDNLFLLNNLQIQRRQMRDEQYSRRL
jgi:hypothetical protein